MNKTPIDWCDYSWNPVVGCWGPDGSEESPNWCPYCYARRFAERGLGEYGLYEKGQRFRPRFFPERLDEPKQVKKHSRIFVCSMADLFGPWVPADWIQEVFRAVSNCPWHTFIFLTKNPDGIPREQLPANAWFGVTAESQKEADKRIPGLLKILAVKRFVSIEPVLGPVDLSRWVFGWDPITGEHSLSGYCDIPGDRGVPGLNWIIIGAQTGPGAKPPEPAWVKAIINQARAADIPVYLKDNIGWPETIQEFPEDGRA